MGYFEDNKFLTFADLGILVEDDGANVFDEIPGHGYDLSPTNLEFITKTDAENILVDVGRTWPAFRALAANQWVTEVNLYDSDRDPFPPYILLTSLECDTICIDWAANPGSDDGSIASYTVYYKVASNPTWSTIAVGLATNRCITGLLEDTFYQVSVKATDNTGNESGFSNILSLTTTTCSTGPSGNNLMGIVDFTGNDCTTISLAWAPPIDVVSGTTVSYYSIEYKLISSGTWLVYGTTTTNLYIVVSGLVQNNDYEFRVRFRTSGSVWSDYQYTTTASTNCSETYPCGPTQVSGTEGYSQTLYYNFVVAEQGTYTDLFFDPYSIPDRVRLYSTNTAPHTLLYDSKYIGISSLDADLLAAGIPQNDIRTGSSTIESPEVLGWGNYGKQIRIQRTLIPNDQIKAVIDAPLGGTAWRFVAGCYGGGEPTDPDPNPIPLTWEWIPANGVGGLEGEMKTIGAQNTAFTVKIEILSASGEWYLTEGTATLTHNDVPYIPYTWNLPYTTTLTSNQSGSYYFSYNLGAYRQTAGSTYCKITMLTATNYTDAEMPPSVAFTF